MTVTIIIGTEWADCFKMLPYKDFNGSWQIPRYTQRRTNNGVQEYRERAETFEEFSDRQW